MRHWVCLVLATSLCSPPFPAWAESAGADPAVTRIRAFYDSLLTVMERADKLGIHGRYEKLTPAIRTTFDLRGNDRIAVGPDWNSISSEQQTALIDTFTRLTISTYAARFDGYSGERFEVDPTAETRNTGRIVRTKSGPIDRGADHAQLSAAWLGRELEGRGCLSLGYNQRARHKAFRIWCHSKVRRPKRPYRESPPADRKAAESFRIKDRFARPLT